MLILNSPQVVQETCLRWKREQKIAFVPTMGCIHEGHLSLIRMAKTFGQKVIVSVFVNPLQFSPGEDFEKYPRVFEEDCAKLEEAGVDLVFHPNIDDLYMPEFTTKVSLGEISNRLCGQFRPGHFEGVATVCLKLFNIIQSDFAIFGEKDFQQLRIIQQMTSDLNLPITIVPHTTVREDGGLALSSRNRYLSPAERTSALEIYKTLSRTRGDAVSNAQARVGDLLETAQALLSKTPLKQQYLAITTTRQLKTANPQDLIHSIPSPHFFIAAFAGTTRLIDNISLNGDQG